MGLSINTYVYSGGSRTFPVNFALGFLNRSDVTVYVEGEFDGTGAQLYRDFTWNSDSEIVVQNEIDTTDGPRNVTVQRTVDKENLIVDFNAEGSATRRNIQFGLQQAMMAMHEFIDGRIEPLETVYPFSAYIESMLEARDATLSAADAAEVDRLAAAASATAAAADRVAAGKSAATVVAELQNLTAYGPVGSYNTVDELRVNTPAAQSNALIVNGSVLIPDLATQPESYFTGLVSQDGRRWRPNGEADFLLAGTTSELSNDFEGRFYQFLEDCAKREVSVHMRGKRDGTPYDGYRYLDYTMLRDTTIIWDSDAVLQPSVNYQHFVTGNGLGPFVITDFNYDPTKEDALSAMLVTSATHPTKAHHPEKLVQGTDFTVTSTGVSNQWQVTLLPSTAVTSWNATDSTLAVASRKDAMTLRGSVYNQRFRLIGDYMADLRNYGYIQSSASGSGLNIKDVDYWLLDNINVYSRIADGYGSLPLDRRGDSALVTMNQTFGRFNTLNALGMNDLALYATGGGDINSRDDDGYGLIGGVINARYCSTAAKIVRQQKSSHIDTINVYKGGTGYLQGDTGGIDSGGSISIGAIKGKFVARRGLDFRESTVGGFHCGLVQIEDLGYMPDEATLVTDAAGVFFSGVHGATVDHVSVVQKENADLTDTALIQISGDNNWGNTFKSGFGKGLAYGIRETGSSINDTGNSYTAVLVDCANPVEFGGFSDSDYDLRLVSTTGGNVTTTRISNKFTEAQVSSDVTLVLAGQTTTESYNTQSVEWDVIRDRLRFTLKIQGSVTHSATSGQFRVHLPPELVALNTNSSATPVTLGRVQGLTLPAGMQLVGEWPANQPYIRFGVLKSDGSSMETLDAQDVPSGTTIRIEVSGVVRV